MHNKVIYRSLPVVKNKNSHDHGHCFSRLVVRTLPSVFFWKHMIFLFMFICCFDCVFQKFTPVSEFLGIFYDILQDLFSCHLYVLKSILRLCKILSLSIFFLNVIFKWFLETASLQELVNPFPLGSSKPTACPFPSDKYSCKESVSFR